MRLLDARALIHEGVSRLVDDAEVGKPYFAILSHTWGQEEVLFEDIALGPNHEVDSLTEEQRATRGYRSGSRMRQGPKSMLNWYRQNEEDRSPLGVCKSCRPRNQSVIRQQGSHIKAGWKKIWSVCLQACRDGYDYVWIDTCCINKSSSTELAEALNSMFEWYAMSSKCYALLEDCRVCPHKVKAQHSIIEFLSIDKCTKAQISHCRWLTRGWTLQELIAPSEITFFDQDWTVLGSRDEFAYMLSDITRIASSILEKSFLFISFEARNTEIKRRLRQFPVARKMSWAANRQTTRVEDRAYSLLGLFGVNMPLLYGEGDKAFLRLQEEIISCSNDDSIFAWEFTDDVENELYENQLLAPSPEYFSWWSPPSTYDLSLYSSATDVENVDYSESFEITQKALHITVPLFHWREEDGSNIQTIHGKKDRPTNEIHSNETLQGCGLQDSNVKEADLLKKVEAPSWRNTSRGFLGVDSNKTYLLEKSPSKESSLDERPIEGRQCEDHTSKSGSSINFKKSQALLKCYLGWGPAATFIEIALRLSHTYVGDRHVVSQVISERPGRHELEKNLRQRIGARFGERHRLALYLSVFETMTTQSVMIRRDNDKNNV